MRLEWIQYLYDECLQETVFLQQETILILKAMLLGWSRKIYYSCIQIFHLNFIKLQEESDNQNLSVE